MNRIAFFIVLVFLCTSFTSGPKLKLALLKYNGGGDWYANPTALTNLSDFCNQNIKTDFDNDYATVEVGSLDIYNHPWLHMTGHGNVVFNDQEAENLRYYLIGGGFLHIDDNYGMDPFVRPALKKVFPELKLTEVPFDHPIYHQKFDFNNGLPKIHKHDDKPAAGYGIFWEDRLVVYYSYETDLGDGWEDQEVHKDSQEKRLESLKMGANIISFAFTQ